MDNPDATLNTRRRTKIMKLKKNRCCSRSPGFNLTSQSSYNMGVSYIISRLDQLKIISAQENFNRMCFVSNYAYLNKSAAKRFTERNRSNVIKIVMQQWFKFELMLVTAVIVNEERGSRTQFWKGATQASFHSNLVYFNLFQRFSRRRWCFIKIYLICIIGINRHKGKFTEFKIRANFD